MNRFFEGWRRKTGMVLLLIGFQSAGMWIRSYWVFDRVDTGFAEIISNGGIISCNLYGTSFGPFELQSSQYTGEIQLHLLGYDQIRYWKVVVFIALIATFLIVWKTTASSEINPSNSRPQ